ncbi:MAG: hypothetical protein DI538_09030 [Azospira oryzae]|jgi:hypothetical protein|nr:MAG: hypothetical protein DI538_09030 [Azospira oryzae]
MKRLFVITVLLLSSRLLLAQDETDQVQRDPKAAEKIQALRTAYISDKLGLTPEQAEKFWPVYREFTQERTKLRQQLKEAALKIDPNNPDPKSQQALVDLGLEVKQKELNLEKDYSGRLLKVITAQQVLNLRKAESDFRELVINQLQQRRLNQQRRENFRERNQQLRRNN